MTARNRNVRQHPTRGRTLSATRATVGELTRLRVLNADYPDVERPRTRGDCVDTPRPCPWVSCRHHLAVDVTSRGSLHLAFTDVDVTELAETCSLDVADRGGSTLSEVGAMLNVTRERVRQVEIAALVRVDRRRLRELRGEDEPTASGVRLVDEDSVTWDSDEGAWIW